MLKQIHIANLATIEEAHLDLLEGTTVITGETGAGKTILIDAIELALGARASPQLIRANQDKMELRLCFDLRKVKNLPDSFTNEDFGLQTEEWIVRRTILRDGRSRSYLNDLPITLPALREFSEALIDIHGQHEQQSLLKSEKQRELVDRYGKQLELVKKIQLLAEEHKKLSQLIQDNQTSLHQREERRDFLRYQLNELTALNLQPQEWQSLEREHQELAHADSLLQNLTQALTELSRQEEKNSLTSLHRVLKSLDMVRQVNPHIEGWAASVKTIIIQLEDLASELARYLDILDLNPQRLQAVEQRMQSIHELARKYKIIPAEFPALLEKLRGELESLDNNEHTLTELRQKQNEVLHEYLQKANKLSQERLKAANKLAKEITQTIQTLALPQAEFQIELQKENENSVSPQGLEKIVFLVKTNRGTSFQPLAKIASGGELSRISLAIHLATAEEHTIPTLIFDEIDVGIGGSTAELVGRLIRRLGKTHQVLCITHLPQVAAYGHQHLAVEKTDLKEQVVTRIRSLTLSDKIKEIARMLGGLNITTTTLDHAQEMLNSVLS